MNTFYTDSERTIAKYKVSDAVKAAGFILRDRYNINKVDTSVIDSIGLTVESPITLARLNELTYKFVCTTTGTRF